MKSKTINTWNNLHMNMVCAVFAGFFLGALYVTLSTDTEYDRQMAGFCENLPYGTRVSHFDKTGGMVMRCYESYGRIEVQTSVGRHKWNAGTFSIVESFLREMGNMYYDPSRMKKGK